MVSAFIPFASFAGNTDETVVNSTAGSTEAVTSMESEPNSQNSENDQGSGEEPEDQTVTEPTDSIEPTNPPDITEPTNITEPPKKKEVAKTSASKTQSKSIQSDSVVESEPGYELTVVGQQQAPLSPGVIDSSCCTLHLLIIILACIATGVYAWDMKKRQARIYELEEELGEYVSVK